MTETLHYLDKFTARKVQEEQTRLLATLPDSLEAWMTRYLQLAVTRGAEKLRRVRPGLHKKRVEITSEKHLWANSGPQTEALPVRKTRRKPIAKPMHNAPQTGPLNQPST